MDRENKIQNIAGAVFIGLIGVLALGGAIFAGATHQIVMVAVCALMVTIFLAEIRQEEKRAKLNKTN